MLHFHQLFMFILLFTSSIFALVCNSRPALSLRPPTQLYWQDCLQASLEIAATFSTSGYRWAPRSVMHNSCLIMLDYSYESAKFSRVHLVHVVEALASLIKDCVRSQRVGGKTPLGTTGIVVTITRTDEAMGPMMSLLGHGRYPLLTSPAGPDYGAIVGNRNNCARSTGEPSTQGNLEFWHDCTIASLYMFFKFAFKERHLFPDEWIRHQYFSRDNDIVQRRLPKLSRILTCKIEIMMPPQSTVSQTSLAALAGGTAFLIDQCVDKSHPGGAMVLLDGVGILIQRTNVDNTPTNSTTSARSDSRI